MSTDLKRLKKHLKAYEPTLKELERKYQVMVMVILKKDNSILTCAGAGVTI